MDPILTIIGLPLLLIFIPIVGIIARLIIYGFEWMEAWLNGKDMNGEDLPTYSTFQQLPMLIKKKYGFNWHLYFSYFCYGIFWLIVIWFFSRFPT
jgi:hypothetical protein